MPIRTVQCNWKITTLMEFKQTKQEYSKLEIQASLAIVEVPLSIILLHKMVFSR